MKWKHRKTLAEWRAHYADMLNAQGCWNWLGPIDLQGYGKVVDPQRTAVWLRAHRVSYELDRGPIPEGLVLDHLCRNRRCVNPDHLEAVTSRENTMRGETIPARNASKVTCSKGHLYDSANTRHDPRGTRACRKCDVIRQAAYKARKRNATAQSAG